MCFRFSRLWEKYLCGDLIYRISEEKKQTLFQPKIEAGLRPTLTFLFLKFSFTHFLVILKNLLAKGVEGGVGFVGYE